MRPSSGAAAGRLLDGEAGEEWGWTLVLAAASAAEACGRENQARTFTLADDGTLRVVAPSADDALLAWRPDCGWRPLLPEEHRQRPLIDLYLPVCAATPSRPVTVGHLGQSLDGFIATHTGDSQFVTGPENLRHMHRMRALSDAIIVGAGTVAADDPQLTTRHVTGPSPVRVILDPMRRLGDHYRVFTDDAVETIYVCGRSLTRPEQQTYGRATLVAIDDSDGGLDAASVLQLLRDRGCHRIFVEGGGVTVSMFFEANLLDRLQMAIAPVIIGDGRPAIRLQNPPTTLGECHRPSYRVFRMGGDILFDCDLRGTSATLTQNDSETEPSDSPLDRII